MLLSSSLPSSQKLRSLFHPTCQESVEFFARMLDSSLRDTRTEVCSNLDSGCESEAVSVMPETVKRHATSILVPFFDIMSRQASVSACKYCKDESRRRFIE